MYGILLMDFNIAIFWLYIKEDREGVNFGILKKIPQKHYPNMPCVVMKKN